MKKLDMTRYECAREIVRIASDLRYHLDDVAEPVDHENRQLELAEEINIRQSYRTLVELLRVMDELI